MKKTKKILSLLLALVMIFALAVPTFAEEAKPLDGKTVILHTNDIHGQITVTKESDGKISNTTKGSLMAYAYVSALKAEYEAKGASVVLADAGDFSQGSPYVSVSKGASAVQMMNAAGYAVATLGNHEFDYGYPQLADNLKQAKFTTVCCNVLGSDGKPLTEGHTIIEKSGVKIGFIGVNTPETQTKANPALIKGIKWLAGDDMIKAVQAEIDAIQDSTDVIVILSHLGVDKESAPNRSVDLWKGIKGADFIIDGHSHTVMTKGENGEPIQSTGTAYANVGVIVIDDANKKIESNELVKTVDSKNADAAVEAEVKASMDAVDAEFGTVFAKSEVDLNGARSYDKATGLYGNRDGETNLGDLITDAMVWKVKEQGGVTVDEKNIVAITNGGGIRAAIKAGDVTKKDINTVLPFGNTLAVVYVKGSELLEALEASTYCSPDSTVGGFPQVSGMVYTINYGKTYDKNDDTYPGSTYYGPKTIKRVHIDSINGSAFDPNATYAVVTNNFCAAGGDTYYAFAAAKSQFDTGFSLDEVVMDYVKTELKGVIGKDYADPQGRIFYEYNPFLDVVPGAWFYDYVTLAAEADIVNGMTPTTFEPDTELTREQYATMLWRMLDDEYKTPKTTELKFKDADKILGYAREAVAWAVENDVIRGYEDNTFRPQDKITRAEIATMTYRFILALEEEKDAPAELKADYGFKDVEVGAWYTDAVNVMANMKIVDGMGNGMFVPQENATRAQAATIAVRFLLVMTDDADE